MNTTYDYEITIIHHAATSMDDEFEGIFLNDEYILSAGDVNSPPGEYGVDAEDFVNYLLEQVRRVI